LQDCCGVPAGYPEDVLTRCVCDRTVFISEYPGAEYDDRSVLSKIRYFCRCPEGPESAIPRYITLTVESNSTSDTVADL
jgi:hypothetical protein